MEIPDAGSFLSVEEAVRSSLLQKKGDRKKESNELAENYRKCLHHYIEHDVDSASKYIPKIRE